MEQLNNGRINMAKARKERASAPETTTENSALSPAQPVAATLPPPGEVSGPAQHAVDSAAGASDGTNPASEARKPIVTPDPRGIASVSLGDTRGSPRVQLRRSHQYRQMQIRFDEQPDEKYLTMLKEAGWRDRTEEEGVWTKQIDKDAVWQSVQAMEREFKDIANAIRKDKGLEPVLQELSVA